MQTVELVADGEPARIVVVKDGKTLSEHVVRGLSTAGELAHVKGHPGTTDAAPKA